MKFMDFLDLVRQHKEVDEEAKRISDLEQLARRDVPTRWIVMALEHFAVMIFVWNAQNQDNRPEFWIAMRSRAYAELMERVAHKVEITIDEDDERHPGNAA